MDYFNFSFTWDHTFSNPQELQLGFLVTNSHLTNYVWLQHLLTSLILAYFLYLFFPYIWLQLAELVQNECSLVLPLQTSSNSERWQLLSSNEELKFQDISMTRHFSTQINETLAYPHNEKIKLQVFSSIIFFIYCIIRILQKIAFNWYR